ncbi:MAG TPA: histidinol-phosphatase [Candidatus Binataceae bacterium]|nr:histidinol-phosphatase [Candidatus Binataceae bacterium]
MGATLSATLSDSELDRYLEFALHLGELAGRAILPHFRAPLEVANKSSDGGFDPVTIADRSAETAIRDEIARVFPSHGVWGEEHGRTAGTSPFTWVIDPIDGTRAFVLGLLQWGTLIALNDGERPVLGVMTQPYVGELFIGSRRGAELRHGAETRALRTRRCPRLADASLASTSPAGFPSRSQRACFDLVASTVRQVRFGTDCYAYCMLAAGLIDLVIESRLNPYDIQAPIAIIEAAGGVVTSWTGGRADAGGAVIAAGDPELHREALKILSLAF